MLLLLIQGLDVLLDRLSDRDIEVRERAMVELGRRSWSDGEIEAIRRAAEGPDPDVALRATVAFVDIAVRRPRLLACLPALPELRRSGLSDLLEDLERRVRQESVPVDEFVPFLIELLDSGEIGDRAREILGCHVLKSGLITREEWRTWWANRNLPASRHLRVWAARRDLRGAAEWILESAGAACPELFDPIP
jgi:hypothetical protein